MFTLCHLEQRQIYGKYSVGRIKKVNGSVIRVRNGFLQNIKIKYGPHKHVRNGILSIG